MEAYGKQILSPRSDIAKIKEAVEVIRLLERKIPGLTLRRRVDRCEMPPTQVPLPICSVHIMHFIGND